MKFKKVVLLLSILAFNPTFIFAQKAKTQVLTTDEAKVVKEDAATYFNSLNFKGALNAYSDLIKTDPKNAEYNYRLGYCYLETWSNKSEAIKYLKKAVDAAPQRKDWLYSLGLAYMYNNQFDEAIAAFRDFSSNAKQKQGKNDLPSDRMIEMCNNAKQLVNQPVQVTFTNLGKNINSSYDEYNPMISVDGKTLVYSTRRKGNVGGFIEDLGIYTSDLYWSSWKDTSWTKAKGLGGMVNTEWDEEIVGMSPVGDQIVIYFDNTETYADLGFASLKGKMWQKPVMFNEKINSKQYEGGAAVSMDGCTVYFSSNRKEGSGGSDLWMIKKGKNGEWSTPVSLGPNINTKYDEDFPMLSLDEKHLYFASKGWNSMGGFDIFRSDYNEATQTWSQPVNIGYPLNDADDNTIISFTGDGKTAYLSAVRPEGMGERDIYKVTFPDESHHPFSKLITGKITGTGGKIEVTKVILVNTASGKEMEYHPAGSGGEYAFTVEEGSYTIKVEGYNFPPFSDNITIGPEMTNAVLEKNIQITAGK